MITKYLYIALGVLAYSTAVWLVGIEYQKAQVAKVTVTQLVKDHKADNTINARSKDRDKKGDEILRNVQDKKPIWDAEPLPSDVIAGLRDAGIPKKP